MKSFTVLGFLLAVLGVLALIYQGFKYTRQENVIEIGPIHAIADRQKHVPLPPMARGLASTAGGSFARHGYGEETKAGLPFVEVKYALNFNN